MSATANKGFDLVHMFYENNDNEQTHCKTLRGARREIFVSCYKPMSKGFRVFWFKLIYKKYFLFELDFVGRGLQTFGNLNGHLKYWKKETPFECCIGCTVERKAHPGCQNILLGVPTQSDWHVQIITLKGTCRHQTRMIFLSVIRGRKRSSSTPTV